MKLKRIAGALLIVVSVGLAAWGGATLWIGKSPVASVPQSTRRLSTMQRFGVGMPYLPDTRVTPDSNPISIDTGTSSFKNRIYLPLIYSHPQRLDAEVVETLNLGWYVAWRVLETPPFVGTIEFWQMIRVREDGFSPGADAIRRAAQANPGAAWLIGNEPDVIWQDDITPDRYAEWYHELYYLLKRIDPTCQVAIGGISQPTPLRLQYLEMVLAAYQAHYGEPMPVDIWNIHGFILREEQGDWGVDIPPGILVDQGMLYDVEDHDNLEIFEANVIAFRQWMADHGQRNKPLVISEYGILLPEAYGFSPERVERFLYGTYNFLLNATDEQIGYPADDNRLVQRWAWYSLSDDRFPSGSLVDINTGDLTSLGEAHQEYTSGLP